jgi:hypothetical protein
MTETSRRAATTPCALEIRRHKFEVREFSAHPVCVRKSELTQWVPVD